MNRFETAIKLRSYGVVLVQRIVQLRSGAPTRPETMEAALLTLELIEVTGMARALENLKPTDV